MATALAASARCAGSAGVVEVALVSHAPVRVDSFRGSKVDWELAVLGASGTQAICDWLSGLWEGEMVAS